jgi:hypothetical protein
MSEPLVRRVSFWRLGLGLALIFLALKNFDTGNIQPDLAPINSTQWITYYAFTVAVLVGGTALVFLGIRKLWRRPPES